MSLTSKWDYEVVEGVPRWIETAEYEDNVIDFTLAHHLIKKKCVAKEIVKDDKGRLKVLLEYKGGGRNGGKGKYGHRNGIVISKGDEVICINT